MTIDTAKMRYYYLHQWGGERAEVLEDIVEAYNEIDRLSAENEQLHKNINQLIQKPRRSAYINLNYEESNDE